MGRQHQTKRSRRNTTWHDGTGPLLPHLFQRVHGARREVVSPTTVYKLINTALAAAGLKDATGQPLAGLLRWVVAEARATPPQLRALLLPAVAHVAAATAAAACKRHYAACGGGAAAAAALQEDIELLAEA